MSQPQNRRDVLKLGGLGVVAGAASLLSPSQAYAQAAPTSLLRTVLDRKKLIVGTGSTNAPWHFEDEKGQLVGMDIVIARILSRACSTIPPRSSSSSRIRRRASRTSPRARWTSSSSS